MKKLSKAQRLEAYKKFQRKLIANPEMYGFFCNHIRDTYEREYNFHRMLFPEYFLFKELESTAWLNKQMDIHYVRDKNVDRKMNERRVFILQLCIEMTK